MNKNNENPLPYRPSKSTLRLARFTERLGYLGAVAVTSAVIYVASLGKPVPNWIYINSAFIFSVCLTCVLMGRNTIRKGNRSNKGLEARVTTDELSERPLVIEEKNPYDIRD